MTPSAYGAAFSISVFQSVAALQGCSVGRIFKLHTIAIELTCTGQLNIWAALAAKIDHQRLTQLLVRVALAEEDGRRRTGLRN